MGVFKEEAHAFKQVAKKQAQIYTDAADNGYPYNTTNPPSEITAVINIIKDLQQSDKRFPDEKNLVRNRQEWDRGVSVDVIIFWERDQGYDLGTKYSISFNNTGREFSKIDKESNAFISVDVERYSEKT